MSVPPVIDQRAQPSPQTKATTLYVGELEPDVDERAIFQHFSKNGFQVSSIRVCRDRDSTRSLGYCYVNFNTHEDASRAIDVLNYTTVEGKTKPIRIMWKISNPYLRKTNVGNLFINHLDVSIDHRSLYDIFSTFGSILSLKIAMDEKGASKGYGFVQFESKESAEKAKTELNGLLFNNKQVRIEDFIPRKDRQTRDPDQNFTNLYVKHLPKDLTMEEFKKMFQHYGEIDSPYLRFDADNNCLGFGYISFKNHESAQQSVEDLHNKEHFALERIDKPLYCARFQPKSERNRRRIDSDSSKAERLPRNNLYIKNLDESVDDESLRNAFKDFGEITSAKVMRTEQGVSKGFGFVCFTNIETAEQALQKMFGSILNGKPLYVAHAQPKEFRRQQLEQQFAKRSPYPHIPFPQGYPFAPNYPFSYPSFPRGPGSFPNASVPGNRKPPPPTGSVPAGMPPRQGPGMPPFPFPYPFQGMQGGMHGRGRGFNPKSRGMPQGPTRS